MKFLFETRMKSGFIPKFARVFEDRYQPRKFAVRFYEIHNNIEYDDPKKEKCFSSEREAIDYLNRCGYQTDVQHEYFYIDMSVEKFQRRFEPCSWTRAWNHNENLFDRWSN